MMYERDSGASEAPRLEDYLQAVSRRKWLVVLAAALGLIAALAYHAARTDTYTAGARVVVGPSPVGSVQENRLEEPNLEREREVLDSVRVAERAIADGLPESDVAEVLSATSVQFTPDSDVLRVSGSTESATRSRAIVNSMSEAYVAVRGEQANALLDEIDATLAEELATATASVEELRAELEQTANDQQSLRSSLQTLLNNALDERRDLESRINDARENRITGSNSAEVLELARKPTTPDGIGRNTLVAAGVAVAIVLGIAMAFLLDRLDTTARDKGLVEQALGVPVLGSIPPFGIANRSGSAALVMLAKGRSRKLQRAREAYRRLRTSIEYLGTQDDVRVFLVTSARPAEGKSITATNLAVALAEGGKRTSLVSGDMRRPTVGSLLSVASDSGLSGFLRGDVTEIPVTRTGVAGLDVVPAGATPDNPGDLLASTRFESLVAGLRDHRDVVLIDSPPVEATADAATIARNVDGVIVVADVRNTDVASLLQLRSQLERAGARLVGAVLNQERDADAGFNLFSMRGKHRYSYERAAAS